MIGYSNSRAVCYASRNRTLSLFRTSGELAAHHSSAFALAVFVSETGVRRNGARAIGQYFRPGAACPLASYVRWPGSPVKFFPRSIALVPQLVIVLVGLVIATTIALTVVAYSSYVHSLEAAARSAVR
jgi:hypothetical protein